MNKYKSCHILFLMKVVGYFLTATLIFLEVLLSSTQDKASYSLESNLSHKLDTYLWHF